LFPYPKIFLHPFISLYHKQFLPSLAAHSTYPFEEILIGTEISPTHYQSVGKAQDVNEIKTSKKIKI